MKINPKKDSVTPAEILFFLSEREYSVVSPQFYRFFDIIDKKIFDQCTFDELLPALVSYCLFTRSEILGFVFNMVDENQD